MITLSHHARIHLSTLIPPEHNLRIAVVGGGCSGLQYKMSIIKETEASDKDYIQDEELFKVVIDPKSFLFLKGVEIDYDFGLNGKGLTYNNPNSKQSCGCGKSFC